MTGDRFGDRAQMVARVRAIVEGFGPEGKARFLAAYGVARCEDLPYEVLFRIMQGDTSIPDKPQPE